MTSINVNQWTFVDKLMYGGLGYGSFCLPSNFFKIIICCLFPPLGEVVNIVGEQVSPDMPYITLDTILILFKSENITKIIYSFLLTTCFYIPGLIYTLGNISDNDTPI